MGPLKILGPSRHTVLRGSRGAPTWDPIMPRDASISDSWCGLFSHYFRGIQNSSFASRVIATCMTINWSYSRSFYTLTARLWTVNSSRKFGQIIALLECRIPNWLFYMLTAKLQIVNNSRKCSQIIASKMQDSKEQFLSKNDKFKLAISILVHLKKFPQLKIILINK